MLLLHTSPECLEAPEFRVAVARTSLAIFKAVLSRHLIGIRRIACRVLKRPIPNAVIGHVFAGVTPIFSIRTLLPAAEIEK